MNVTDRLLKFYDRAEGASAAVAVAVYCGRPLLRMLSPLARLSDRPSLRQLADETDMHYSSTSFLKSLLGATASMSDIRAEFNEVQADVLARYNSVGLSAPTSWAIESETGFVLYAAVRTLRPKCVVETGVANGHSSSILLAALTQNDYGRLRSFDVVSDAGALVPSEARARWEFAVLEGHRPAKDFANRISGGPPVDLFFHDSDHSYLGQLSDFRAVWPHLGEGAVFLADDVDESWAFVDFAESKGLKISTFLDRRKIIGGLAVPTREVDS